MNLKELLVYAKESLVLAERELENSNIGINEYASIIASQVVIDMFLKGYADKGVLDVPVPEDEFGVIESDLKG